MLSEAVRLVSVDPALAWTQANVKDVQDFVITLGSLAVGPSPPALRRIALEAVMEIMADLAATSQEEEADVARKLGGALYVSLVQLMWRERAKQERVQSGYQAAMVQFGH